MNIASILPSQVLTSAQILSLEIALSGLFASSHATVYTPFSLPFSATGAELRLNGSWLCPIENVSQQPPYNSTERASSCFCECSFDGYFLEDHSSDHNDLGRLTHLKNGHKAVQNRSRWAFASSR